MRKALVGSLLVLLAGAADANAQTGSAPVDVIVSTDNPMVIVQGTTSFGNVNPSNIVEGSVRTKMDPRTPGGGQSVALFIVTADPNATLSITCAPPTNLTLNTNPSQFVTFSGQSAYSTEQTNQAGANLGCNWPVFGLGPNFTAELNATGKLYMWLGGSLSPGSASPPAAGTYSGTFAVTFTYQ